MERSILPSEDRDPQVGMIYPLHTSEHLPLAVMWGGRSSACGLVCWCTLQYGCGNIRECLMMCAKKEHPEWIDEWLYRQAGSRWWERLSRRWSKTRYSPWVAITSKYYFITGKVWPSFPINDSGIRTSSLLSSNTPCHWHPLEPDAFQIKGQEVYLWSVSLQLYYS